MEHPVCPRQCPRGHKAKRPYHVVTDYADGSEAKKMGICGSNCESDCEIQPVDIQQNTQGFQEKICIQIARVVAGLIAGVKKNSAPTCGGKCGGRHTR